MKLKNNKKHNIIVIFTLLTLFMLGVILLITFSFKKTEIKILDFFGPSMKYVAAQWYATINDSFGVAIPIYMAFILSFILLESYLKYICSREDLGNKRMWVKRNHNWLSYSFYGVVLIGWIAYMVIWIQGSSVKDMGFGKGFDFSYMGQMSIRIATQIMVAIVGVMLIVFMGLYFRLKVFKTDFWLTSRYFEVALQLTIYIPLSFIAMYILKNIMGRPSYVNYILFNGHNNGVNPLLKIAIVDLGKVPTFINEDYFNYLNNEQQQLLLSWLRENPTIKNSGINIQNDNEIINYLWRTYFNDKAWAWYDIDFKPWYSINNFPEHWKEFVSANHTEPLKDGWSSLWFPSGHMNAYLSLLVANVFFLKTKRYKKLKISVFIMTIIFQISIMLTLLMKRGHYMSDIAYTIMLCPIWFILSALIIKKVMPVISLKFNGSFTNANQALNIKNDVINNIEYTFMFTSYFEQEVLIKKVKTIKLNDSKLVKIKKRLKVR